MGLLSGVGDALKDAGSWTWDHKMQVGAAALGAGAIIASGGTAAPLVLGAAAAGGGLGAGKELYEKYGDNNPNNDKWNWGSVASGSAYGAGAGALMATPGIAAARAGAAGAEATTAGAEAAGTAAKTTGASRALSAGQFGGTASNAYQNYQVRSDLHSIAANTAMDWQTEAKFGPKYGAANSSDYIS